jgi:hypothetical protein
VRQQALIEVSVDGIIERYCFGWRVIHAHTAARQHDPSAIAANPMAESIDERKMPYVFDNTLKSDTVTPRWDGGICEIRIRDDGIQRPSQVAYRIRR